MRETYAPFILRCRAKALSRVTGSRYVYRIDAGQPPKSLSQELSTSFTRCFAILCLEPIVLMTSLYIAIVYGTLYMFFAGFPIVFEEARGWSQGKAGLPFIGVAVGVCLAIVAAGADSKRFVRISAVAQKERRTVQPEARLRTAMIGSVILPIGLFLFAWTTYPSVPWILPIIGAMFFACGLVMVFISFMGYLVDSCRSPFLSLRCLFPRICKLIRQQTQSMQLLFWQPTRCFALCLAQLSRCSRLRCTTASETSGRALFQHSSLLDVCLSRSSFTGTVLRFAQNPGTPPKLQR